MLSNKLQSLARAIDRARRAKSDPGYVLGVHTCAHALADDLCTADQRLHFLLMAGVPFVLGAP